jgi:hypothetical protein
MGASQNRQTRLHSPSGNCDCGPGTILDYGNDSYSPNDYENDVTGTKSVMYSQWINEPRLLEPRSDVMNKHDHSRSNKNSSKT